MQIDKSMILDLLRQRGDDQQAQQAEQDMPEKVDTEKDAGLLQRFGIDPGELMSKFGGGGGGGLGGMLGGK